MNYSLKIAIDCIKSEIECRENDLIGFAGDREEFYREYEIIKDLYNIVSHLKGLN